MKLLILMPYILRVNRFSLHNLKLSLIVEKINKNFKPKRNRSFFVCVCLYVCTDIEKDLALWEEARLSRSPSIQHHSLVTSDHQGNLQAAQGQNPRHQVPPPMGKNVQLQGNKSPPLPTNSRAQVSSLANSRPPTPGAQTNRSSTPSTPGSRPVTPNSLLSRPLTPSNQGNKEGVINMHRSRSLTSKSQMGRTLSAASGLSVQMSGDVVGTVTTQRSSLSEVRFSI